MSDNTQALSRSFDDILDGFTNRLEYLRNKQAEKDGRKLSQKKISKSDELTVGKWKQKSFKDMSDDILKLTGEYVSHTQLSKYHKMGDTEEFISPNIRSVLAIAHYYGVSVEYLLGLSDTKSYEDKYKIGSKAFGLSDGTMEFLEQYKNTNIFNVPPDEDTFKKFSGADFINFIVDNLLEDFHRLCNRYLYDLQELEALKRLNQAIGIDPANIKVSLKNMDKIQEEYRRQEDMVSHRKFQMWNLVCEFLDELSKEILERENEKETD